MANRTVGPWVWRIDALILAAAAGGVVWAVTAGDRESAAYLALAAWTFLLALAIPRATPDAAAWGLVLIAGVCGAAAVGFFCLYQWAGWPVMAYVDSISTGAIAVLAAVALWAKWSRTGTGPGDTDGQGERQAVGRS